MEYDILALNVGSRTRHARDTPGVEEFSLTTRPINELLGKIERKEKELLEKGIIPRLVVCGAGCAGVELSFSFKNRWQKLFGQDHIETHIITNHDRVLPHERDAAREEIVRNMHKQGIQIHTNETASEVTAEGVRTENGTLIEGNVVVWCTGAEP